MALWEMSVFTIIGTAASYPCLARWSRHLRRSLARNIELTSTAGEARNMSLWHRWRSSE